MTKNKIINAIKKKGFTLIEILVVVLLVGILAGMALPQYMKVVEKQKGTDAVNLLTMISKAQERYYTSNEAYTKDFSELDADIIDDSTKTPASRDSFYTKYFKFQLVGTEDGTSKVRATRIGNEYYVLEKNYTNGRVCCSNDNTEDGDICDVLNIKTGDCGGKAEGDTSTTVTPTPTPSGCSGTAPSSSEACSSGCGTQTRGVSCNGSSWVVTGWDTSSCSSPTQTQATSQACPSGVGTQTRTCTASCTGGTCGAWVGTCSTTPTTCDPATKPNYTSKCGCGDLQFTYACNESTLTWSVASTTCINEHSCGDPSETRSCGDGHGTQRCGTTCEWSTSSESCVCNAGYTWNGTTCVAQCTGCTPGETQIAIPNAPFGVAGTKTCSNSCEWVTTCPTNSQWNATYSSCIGRHLAGREIKEWMFGLNSVTFSTCNEANCQAAAPGQNVACTGTPSCAIDAISRVNYDCTQYPYTVTSYTLINNGTVCDCKYIVNNLICTYDPTATLY